MIAVHENRGKYQNAQTGHYFPLHPEKYQGHELPIYKSGLELRMMQYLDKNPAIVKWNYESKVIKYFDKTSTPPKPRRYFIDFTAIVKSGIVQKVVWLEVKPYAESVQPKNSKNVKAQLLWIKNQSKWNAARLLAKSQGAEFHVITEQQLN